MRFAHLHTGDAATAQDLVQEALVKVFVRTRSGFEPERMESYVRRAITTAFIDGHRKRRTFRDVHHLVAAPDRGPGPENGTVDRLDLRAALDLLTPQERSVVVLRYYEDLRVADIAEAMGLAAGTVKRYLSNAVAKLEKQLGPVARLDHDDVVTVRTRGRS